MDGGRVFILGYLMGGYGVLILYLKNFGVYKSVSVWVFILNLSKCLWGEKVFSGYFGDDKEEWKKYDVMEFISGWKGFFNVFVDVVSFNIMMWNSFKFWI